MQSPKNYTISFLIIISILMVSDLIVKSLVINHLDIGEHVKIFSNIFTITRVPTMRMSFGFDMGHKIVAIIKVVIQILVLLLMIRIQKIDVNKLFKYSTVLIICGYIGNHLDRILFSNGDNMYVLTGYISWFNTYVNLSSLMVVVGWSILIISIFISFKDLKVIFSIKN